ncbi:MAG: hypothetical protein NVSMB12_09370 [Acidimicrobiales bacterium]
MASALPMGGVMPGCDTHPFDAPSGTCRLCRRAFCESCLVYTLGPEGPPTCVPCALESAGVRRSRRRPLRQPA